MFHVKRSPLFVEQFYKSFSEQENFRKILSSVNNRDRPITISGLSGSAVSLFSYTLRKQINQTFLIILKDRSEAEEIRDDLDFFLGDSYVSFLPGSEIDKSIFADFDSISTYFYNDTIEKILNQSNPIVVATKDGLLTNLHSPDFVRSHLISLKINQQFERDYLIKLLTDFGYEKVFTVEYPMEFSVKGSMVDFYPTNSTLPFRIEFFGDTIESVRSFSPEDQISKQKLNSVTIIPPVSSKSEKKNSNIFSYLALNSIIISAHSEEIDSSITKKLENYKQIRINDYFKSEYNFNTNYPTFPDGKLQTFKQYLSKIPEIALNPKTYIIASTKDQCKRLETLLQDSSIIIQEGILSRSVEFPDIGFYAYSDHDIFVRRRKTNTFKKLPKDLPLQKVDTKDISPGDLMVHINYGIGEYQGLQKVNAFGSTKECIILKYRDGDRVFIPLERLKDIQKYKSTDGFSPQLTKLGTGEWEKTKLRTRKSLERISEEIIELYALRMNTQGFAFEPDTDLQLEMESEFIYDETPDQQTTTEEIKRDMEKPQPMDRLLCGDVGFGKTEVAIRATFKAVSNSKQVAVMVPTTILADQHYRTFKERLRNFPINIALLSRFTSRKANQKILKGIAEGSIDILIGTHKLLSDNVRFRDLGLLVIDEEHRFGVRQKERIKKLKTNVDSLALTATPIPRTLQLSLIGARDSSIINTPPKSRLPIYTEIIPFNTNIIKKAVYRELSRGGQIYFVHNKVKSIPAVTYKLRTLFPNVRIEYVHGQMPEKELEPIMSDFFAQDIDILVTTAIIESGIDIPNVNTIFINKAHTFGLAQLYQLRGRVGRGNRRAYSYLIIPQVSRLNQAAKKRLQTIQRNTSLGSGYSIALRDLEIRGAGNLFGLEQSGNIQAIGYDLYMKILKDSLEKIKQKKGITAPEKTKMESIETELIYPHPAYFPETYIPSSSVRIDFYKRMSESESIQDIDNIEIELVDRYGKIPQEGHNLLDISRIRVLCNHIGFSKLEFSEKSTTFEFVGNVKDDSKSNVFNAVQEVLHSLGANYKFIPSNSFKFSIFHNGDSPLSITKQFLFLLNDKFNL